MENTNDIMLGDRSLDEWVNMYPAAQDASISPEQAIKMGVLQPTEPSQETQTEITKSEPVEPQGEEREYKKLSKIDTVKDIGKTIGAEALRIVAPKADSKMAEWLHYSEDDMYQHQAQTRIGETSKYLYRYGMGTLSFIFGGGKVGAAIKGIGMAKNSMATMQLGKGIQQLMGADKLIKTGAKAGTLKKAGAFLGNASLSGATAGAMADFSLYSKEEGHMADAFGVTDNPLLTYLQTDENDSMLEARFKNVVEGFIMGIPFGIGVDGARAAGAYFKSMRKAAQAQTAEEATKTLAEATQAEQTLNKVLSTAELADTVKNMKTKADAEGLDAEQMIMDNLSNTQYDEAKKMLKTYNQGEQIFIHEDGTWDIAVQKWDDASKVSPEEYKKQLAAADKALADDPANIDVRAGDTAIQHQDDAVKHTWTNRGWIGENETLTAKNSNKIAKNYKDKWQIDNKIKVEFVDGLTVNGNAVEGNTSATQYLGKTSKNKQNAIDKKKLQIQKLEDKITMAEGGNKEVTDPLDNLKEELRIANNELKELEKSAKGQDRISDITIQIDKNAKNPYATLRSELEHARDLSKGEVPKDKTKHFSRYEGANEGEVASGYVYKKSQGKAQKTAIDTSISEPKAEVEAPKQVEEVKVEPETPVQPQQLKLDFTSAEEIPTKLASGELKGATAADIDTMITKGAELDVEISGTDWKALAKDADNIPTNIKELLDMEEPETIHAFFSETDATLGVITRKQLFATKVISQLRDKLQALGTDASLEAKKSIIDSIEWLKEYKKSIGSGLGRGLNEQKFVNEALQTFGSKRFSELNRQGIHDFVDLLQQISKDLNLNFTRGELLKNKTAIIQQIMTINPALAQSFVEAGGKVLQQVDDIITEIAKGGDKAVLDKLTQDLADVFVNPEYEALLKAQELAPTKEGWWNCVKKWTNQKGGIASFYVHNLLSSPASIIKNVVSGGLNTIYFPAKKMLCAFDPFTKDQKMKDKLFREGARTYSNLIASWSESWQLAAQAFIKGEGRLSSFGADTLNMNEETFRGFHEWGNDANFGVTMQNIHSVMTRLMGASDEFLSQLNYRAIARGRASEMAEAMLEAAGKQGDEQYYKETYNIIFDSFFEKDTGKPTNLDIFNEAKKMLYQTPLSGKIQDNLGRTLDIRTGNELQNGEKASQTAVMMLGEKIQNSANKNIFTKFYFPFVKTGVNILQENLDHNLWYNLASPQQREILKSQTKEGALLRSQCAFGAFSFMFASGLALNGVITGAMPSDAKERKALLATGWRPYSWKIGDTYVSYQGYEPIHTMLGFAADLTNLMMSVKNREDEDKVSKYALEAGAAFVNNFLDKAAFRTGLQSISSLMELNESNLPNLKKAIAQPIQGILPMSSLVRNTSSIGTRDAKSPQTITERVFNNYFNRGLGEYRRNAFGEKQSITNWIITTSSEQPNEQAEDMELNRLAELGYKPSEVSEKIAGYSINYNDFVDKETGRTAYDLMMDELSKTDIRQAVRDLVTSEYYQNLDDGINNNMTKALGFKWTSSDETKVNALNDIFIEYNDRIKEEIVDKYPNLYNKDGVSLLDATEKADTVKEMKQNGMSLQNNAAELFNSLF